VGCAGVASRTKSGDATRQEFARLSRRPGAAEDDCGAEGGAVVEVEGRLSDFIAKGTVRS
jgi:hypothetical protein